GTAANCVGSAGSFTLISSTRPTPSKLRYRLVTRAVSPVTTGAHCGYEPLLQLALGVRPWAFGVRTECRTPNAERRCPMTSTRIRELQREVERARVRLEATSPEDYHRAQDYRRARTV